MKLRRLKRYPPARAYLLGASMTHNHRTTNLAHNSVLGESVRQLVASNLLPLCKNVSMSATMRLLKPRRTEQLKAMPKKTRRPMADTKTTS